MQVISFDVSGSFAAFKDPSVTTNQTVYYIPSKTAVVGMIGALLGVKRDNMLGSMYGKEFLDFYKKTKIGIRVNSADMNKVTLYTNHRSLKERKTKPVKKEILENPSYTFYVLLDDHKELLHRLQTNSYVFTPYMGHAYCPATIKDPRCINATKSDKSEHTTSCVVLDESKPFNSDFEFTADDVDDDVSLLLERHLHNYFVDDTLTKRVMLHWIPVGGSITANDNNCKRQISAFYKVSDQNVCLY